MSARPFRRACGALAAAALSACSSGATHLATPAPAGRAEFAPLLVQASEDAGAGRYAVADKLLADFTVRYPASAEAAEAMFWRALYKLDPANTAAVPRDAAMILEGYLASGSTAHRTEAQLLRRVAASLEPRGGVTAGAPAKVELVKADDKARDEEIQRLKDELAKANAELERIKRRLRP